MDRLETGGQNQGYRLLNHCKINFYKKIRVAKEGFILIENHYIDHKRNLYTYWIRVNKVFLFGISKYFEFYY